MGVRARLRMLGQTIRRAEDKQSLTSNMPQEMWHRFSGREMGYVGHSVNNDVSYTDSISNRVFGEDITDHANFDSGSRLAARPE
jgi:hypothetical protein